MPILIIVHKKNNGLPTFPFKIFLLIILVLILGSIIYLYNTAPRVTVSNNPVTSSVKTEVISQLIPDFSDFPIYPGSVVINSYKKTESNSVGYEVNLKSKDPVNQVMAWYQTQLSQREWRILESPDFPDSLRSQTLIVQKGPQKLILTVEDEHQVGKTEIGAEVPLFIPE